MQEPRLARPKRVWIALISAMSLILVAAPATMAEVPNGGFDDGVGPWWSYGTTSLEVIDGQLCAGIPGGTANPWDIGIGQNGLSLPAGEYEFSFFAQGDGGPIAAKVQLADDPWTEVTAISTTANPAGETTQSLFTSTGLTGVQVVFQVGGSPDPWTLCIDDVSIASTAEPAGPIVANGAFDGDFAPWWTTGNVTSAEVIDGQFCVGVPGGTTNPWDVIVGQNDVTIPAGTYQFSFEASGEGPVRAIIGLPVDPYTVFALVVTTPGATTQAYSVEFTAATELANVQVAFQAGGSADPWTLCIDNVMVEEEETPPPPITASLVINGGFDGGSAPWWTTGNATSAGVIDGQYCVGVPGGTTNPWDVIVGQNDLALPAGDYTFAFEASGEGPVRAIVGLPVDPYTVYAEVNTVPGPTTQSYTANFTAAADLPNVQVAFQVGGSATPWTLCIDNVSVLPPTAEYVINGGFDDGSAPWWTTGNVTSSEVIDGQFCVGVPGGTINPWDVIVGQNDLALPAGDYLFSFDASGEGPVRAIIGLPVNPYTVYAEVNAVPGPTTQSYEKGFAANEDLPNVQVAFQVGGSADPWTLCIDNVSVLGGGELPVYTPDTGPRVRVNQVGYLLHGPKKATLVTEAAEAVAWELMSGGAAAASGLTAPQGIDPSSALNVHTIDFGAVVTAGVYTLVADGEESYPFEIGTNAYETLRIDALNYYYPARSGIAIDGAIAGEAYARPAGHVSVAGGSDTNQGDYAVPCQLASESLVVYGEPWTCDYTLDVVGGWYDAGDHGKYVVNGGISVAQLLSTYERTKNAFTADLGALADGTLAVPETGNGVPDVLDEARWQLEFMLSMMVPEGEELAGMVHHKIHDFGWTGLPLMPHHDGQTRYLHRPSTAATLNLAATAAQGARLFAPYDQAFANELLAAARTTWAAALANPALYAPGADGANGGGPYNDSDVTDEFYWAAAELYITTGEAEFKNAVLASPHHTGNVFSPEGFSWGSVAALGRMDLATVPNKLPGRSHVIASVIVGADSILAVQQGEAFGLAYAGDANGDFVWGSNSQILNNMVVLGTAYDLSGKAKYRDAAVESMDYLLGRNALNISYVTGYGTVYSENQHSRWWAAQLNPALPHPPNGSVSGGPNSYSGTWDPTAAGLFTEGCAPQFCYVDNINSWATNEITINWNSALSWVASFLADQDSGKAPKPVCSVVYTAMQLPNNKLVGQATAKNAGSSTLDGWELTWAYPGDQTVKERASLSQDGAWVAAFGLKAKVKPAKSVMVPFIGDAGDLAKASPEQFWLNGNACTTTLSVTKVLPSGKK